MEKAQGTGSDAKKVKITSTPCRVSLNSANISCMYAKVEQDDQ